MSVQRKWLLAAAPILLVGMVVGWVLVSPLFIRPSLVEDSPLAGVPTRASAAPTSQLAAETPFAAAQAQVGQTQPLATATPQPAAGATPGPTASAPGTAPRATAPAGPTLLAEGTFDVKDSVHRGSGKALLGRTPDGKTIVRFEDFSVTNGPDLYVYLSAHPRPGTSKELHESGLDLNLGRLKAPQGAFSYEVPEGVDLEQIKSVAVYCRAFSVMFSSAELQPVR